LGGGKREKKKEIATGPKGTNLIRKQYDEKKKERHRKEEKKGGERKLESPEPKRKADQVRQPWEKMRKRKARGERKK